MRRSSLHLLLLVALGVLVVPRGILADDGGRAERPAAAAKVYGEWRIRPRPGQGAAYRQLIEQKGLALFRAGGGRMVGWWNTLVGDLYEHVTVWEYDDLAAYQKAVEALGQNPAFVKFAAEHDRRVRLRRVDGARCPVQRPPAATL